MKAKKLLRKSMDNSIAEYNRVHAILYPNSETVQLTTEQWERLDLAGIDSIMIELAAERDRILLEQSKRELAGYNDYHVDGPMDHPDTSKIKTKKY
jgi:hypothetical protein